MIDENKIEVTKEQVESNFRVNKESLKKNYIIKLSIYIFLIFFSFGLLFGTYKLSLPDIFYYSEIWAIGYILYYIIYYYKKIENINYLKTDRLSTEKISNEYLFDEIRLIFEEESNKLNFPLYYYENKELNFIIFMNFSKEFLNIVSRDKNYLYERVTTIISKKKNDLKIKELQKNMKYKKDEEDKK